jgi:hypothetical protein
MCNMQPLAGSGSSRLGMCSKCLLLMCDVQTRVLVLAQLGGWVAQKALLRADNFDNTPAATRIAPP